MRKVDVTFSQRTGRGKNLTLCREIFFSDQAPGDVYVCKSLKINANYLNTTCAMNNALIQEIKSFVTKTARATRFPACLNKPLFLSCWKHLSAIQGKSRSVCHSVRIFPIPILRII